MEFDREILLKSYRFNLKYAADLVADIEDDLLYSVPAPGLENTPGFTLGHLVTGSTLIAQDLGENCSLPQGWDDFFLRRGPGDPRLPTNDAPDLPGKAALLQELTDRHRIVEGRIEELDNDRFFEPCQWRFSNYYPTFGDMLIFMCVSHEAMHLAQLAAWRRAFGMESSLARL